MSVDKKLIVVLGATGAQGGSVVDALLEDGGFRVRAVTRNPESDKAKALKGRGVDVVKANNDDQKSLEEAFAGAHGVYALTNFWDPASMGKETQQGKNLAKAAKTAGVEHYVWSTLPDVKKFSDDKYDVPHFTHKAAVDDYIKELGLKHTFVVPSCYYQNFGTFVHPAKQDDGSFKFVFNIRPDSPIAMFDVRDTGKAVLAVFKDPEKWLEQVVFLVDQNTPFKEVFNEEVQKLIGKVQIEQISLDAYKGLGFPGAAELGNMWGWFDEYTYGGPEYRKLIDTGKEAHPGIRSFLDYVKDTGLKLQ